MASTSTDCRTETALGNDLLAIDRIVCDYCGDTAGIDITETVAVGHGPVFSRVVAACSLCAGFRVQGLGHDASWVVLVTGTVAELGS